MGYSIKFKTSAEKEINALADRIQVRILKEIIKLSGDPRLLGYKKLKTRDAYRVRIGDYRVIYEIHDDVLVVLVIRVAHRREAYQG
jgi:mRNA interferase RelE/StbE